MSSIQSKVQSMPELSKEVTINAPYLIQRYFSKLIDFGQVWNWADSESYHKVLALTQTVHKEVKDTSI